jgi:hypothetical protein
MQHGMTQLGILFPKGADDHARFILPKEVESVDTGGKSSSTNVSIFFIFLDTDPHLASVVCVPLSLFRFEIRVVCVWELVYVCACEHKFGVATNHGKF